MQMMTRAAPIAHLQNTDIHSPLDAALLHAARQCDLWYCPERGRPCMLIDGAPVRLPRPRKDGGCPASSHRTVRAAVEGFKKAAFAALTPTLAPSNSRRLEQYATLLARQDGHTGADGLTTALRQATESGASDLAWKLAEIPEAAQRPVLSHLEHAFAAWLSEQVPDATDALIVMERQAAADLARIAGEEVPLRLVRWLAVWNGFRRVHARRARLLIRP